MEAFRKFLEPHFDVVGTAKDGVALLEGAQTLRPDVVVTDLAMPVLNGLDASRKPKQTLPEVKLIFLTMNEDPDFAIQTMR